MIATFPLPDTRGTMTLNLTGQLLLSTPAIGDPRFARSVIYLCEHSADGAFGLVVNRPVPFLRLRAVLDQLGIATAAGVPDVPVMGGGPVETQRGFVLHRDDWPDQPADRPLPGGLALSSSTEILAAIARGQGPSDWLLALGYAGWGPGQLEAELIQNAWLTRPADAALIFNPERGEGQWLRALREMGIDPVGLSATAGRA
jgi:putative transcriptional regulator